MSESNKILLGSLLRHGLGIFGAWLASHGYVDANNVSDYAEAIVGAIIVIVTIVSSVVAKRNAIESAPRNIS